MKEKNTKYRETKTKNYLPTWNLGDLYTSISSKKINNDLIFIRKKTKSFEKKYQNKILNLSSSEMHKAIIQLEIIDEKMDKILSFAHLLVSENINNEKNKIFLQEMQEKITSYFSNIIFFNLELNKIEERTYGISKIIFGNFLS